MGKKGGKLSNIKNHSVTSNKSPKMFSFQKTFYDKILTNPNISLERKDRKLKELMGKSENTSAQYSPLSGYEPKYEPELWNNNPNIMDTHNCYSYSVDVRSSRKGKAQPGYFSSHNHISNNDYSSCTKFYQRLKKDIPGITLATFGNRCPKGTSKNFIAVSPKDDTDYHFYRQDSPTGKNKQGLWSHKPGRTKVINTDADGKLILNPVKANRKYTHLDYSKPCFFYCNPKGMARSSSVSTHK
jgi:hypothetical protein